jgi:hypothetical protein
VPMATGSTPDGTFDLLRQPAIAFLNVTAHGQKLSLPIVRRVHIGCILRLRILDEGALAK